MASELPNVTAALVALTEAGIPTDVQELLVRGDASRGIAPGAIIKALNTRPAPAATDTGLETVAWQHQDYDEWHETRVPEYHKNRGKNVRELVTRSQAEAIIRDLETKILDAAISDRLDDAGSPLSWQERAEKAEADLAAEREKALFLKTAMEIAQTHCGLKDKTIDSLEADNAAQAARIKELEQVNAVLMGDDEDKPRYTTKRLKHEISRATEALEAKLAAAELALEFYADASKWNDGYFKSEDDGTVLRAYPSSIEKDQGDKARAVLGGKPS